MTKINVMAGEV